MRGAFSLTRELWREWENILWHVPWSSRMRHKGVYQQGRRGIV